LPESASQSFRVVSELPDRAVRPSGEKATEETSSECPVKVRSFLPVTTSHSFRVASELPDRAVRPSGEKATDKTQPECPVKVSIDRSLISRQIGAPGKKVRTVTAAPTIPIRINFNQIGAARP